MVGETECGAIPQTDRSESLLNVIELFLCELFASFQCVDMICLVIEERESELAKVGEAKVEVKKRILPLCKLQRLVHPSFLAKFHLAGQIHCRECYLSLL